MNLPYNKDLKGLARSLRNGITDAERKLWSAIRRKQVRGRLFSRQKTIGNYIVDFFCASASLVIELDGGQHYTTEGQQRDNRRDHELANLGLKVLRFTDREVLTSLHEVLEEIWKACDEEDKPPQSPFAKGGGTVRPDLPVSSNSGYG